VGRSATKVSAGLHASRGSVSTLTLRAAAALSLLAATMHLWVVPEHLGEWWGYGTFFVILAVAQGLYALVLLRRPSRPLLLLGVGGNLAVAILWLVTRTTGIPLLGPHAGEVEGVGALDLACTLGEVGIVAGLGVLAMRGLPTEGRIQVVVVAATTSLLFWHLLHLLTGASSH
jgi:manganese oxidase